LYWRFISTRGPYLRFDVSANKVKGPSSRIRNFLSELTSDYVLPDLSLIYLNQDIVGKRGLKTRLLSLFVKSVPVFVSAKTDSDRNQVLFCDWHYDPNETGLSSWNGMVRCLAESNELTNWESKHDKLIWRGGPNDGIYTPENIARFPRGRLVSFAKMNPDLIDASFNNYPPNFVEHLSFFERAYGTKFMSPLEMSKYKYQIDIDGVTATFSGLSWKLLSGSLVLKQESLNKTWFHDFLIPWKHYIPLLWDLSDLLEKLEWAKKHDIECRTIAESGRDFALNFILPKNMRYYCYHVLVNYARCFKPQS
jgi:hypothetical protein